MSEWRFNKNYKDLEQVAPFLDDYMNVYEELAAAGQYPYNDCFKGRIPGIAGAGEDTAIYLLQSTRHLREHEAKIAEYVADGYEPIDHLDEATKFAGIVVHSFEMGGTGRRVYHNARLIPTDNGRLHAVLPKGRRTNGYLIDGKVLVKR